MHSCGESGGHDRHITHAVFPWSRENLPPPITLPYIQHDSSGEGPDTSAVRIRSHMPNRHGL